jgi:4-amino-4-deoxy-L-arabinose transferase-like glycosyltransferase
MSFHQAVRVVTLILTVAFILTVLVQGWGLLSANAFWVDEVFTTYMMYAFGNFERWVLGYLIEDPHPPIYPLLVYPIAKIFGYSETVMRLPSFTFILISGALIYRMCAWLYGRSIGLGALVVFLALWPSVFNSQEARDYSLLIVMTSFALPVGLRLSRAIANDEGVTVQFWPVTVILIALNYTSYFGSFMSAAILTLPLVVAIHRRHWRACGVVVFHGLVSLAAFLPWVALNATVMSKRGAIAQNHERFGFHTPDLTFVFDEVPNYLLGPNAGTFLVMVGVIALGGLLITKFANPPRGGDDGPSSGPVTGLDYAYFAVVIVIAIAIPVVISLQFPIVMARHLVGVTPALAILVTIIALGPWRRRASSAVLAVIMLGFVNHTLSVADIRASDLKVDIDVAADYLLERRKDGEPILIYCYHYPQRRCDSEPPHSFLGRYIHYLNRATLPATPILPEYFVDEKGPEDASARAAAYRAAKTPVVFLYGIKANADKLVLAREALTFEGYICESHLFHRARVEECRLG